MILKAEHFTDELIEDIFNNQKKLTAEERDFLIKDTPRYEECGYTELELAAMSDINLLHACYGVWANYLRDMF